MDRMARALAEIDAAFAGRPVESMAHFRARQPDDDDGAFDPVAAKADFDHDNAKGN